MPEEYAGVVNPLVDELMRELQNGTGFGAQAVLLTKRLGSLGAKVSVISKRHRKAVLLHWSRKQCQEQSRTVAAAGQHV